MQVFICLYLYTHGICFSVDANMLETTTVHASFRANAEYPPPYCYCAHLSVQGPRSDFEIGGGSTVHIKCLNIGGGGTKKNFPTNSL